MKETIIPIERANEIIINALINIGILKITNTGIKCIEENGKLFFIGVNTNAEDD